MSFAIENEKQNRMFILNVQIICEDKTFTTSVYCRPTFIGVYTHFGSLFHLPLSLVLFTYSLLDASKYTQVGVNDQLN